MKHDCTKPYESSLSRHERLFAPGEVPFVRDGFRRRVKTNPFELCVLAALWIMLISFALMAIWSVPGCTQDSALSTQNSSSTTHPTTQPSTFDNALHNGLSGSEQGAGIGAAAGVVLGNPTIGGIAGAGVGFLVGFLGTLFGFKANQQQKALTVVHTVSAEAAGILPLLGKVPGIAGPIAATAGAVAGAVADATNVPVKT